MIVTACVFFAAGLDMLWKLSRIQCQIKLKEEHGDVLHQIYRLENKRYTCGKESLFIWQRIVSRGGEGYRDE